MFTRFAGGYCLDLQGLPIQGGWLLFTAAPEAFLGLTDIDSYTISFLLNNGKYLPVDKA